MISALQPLTWSWDFWSILAVIGDRLIRNKDQKVPSNANLPLLGLFVMAGMILAPALNRILAEFLRLIHARLRLDQDSKFM